MLYRILLLSIITACSLQLSFGQIHFNCNGLTDAQCIIVIRDAVTAKINNISTIVTERPTLSYLTPVNVTSRLQFQHFDVVDQGKA